MRLNGIYADPGTIIGRRHSRDFMPHQLMVADVSTTDEFLSRSLPLRKMNGIDRINAVQREPRSVTEHENLRRIRTVYGMARTFNPDTKGLGPVEEGSFLDRMRTEKKIKVAQRRVKSDLRHLYRLRESQ